MIEPMQPARFNAGDTVYKTGAGYSGPGMVMASFRGVDGHWRYVVSHVIEGGDGTFYHIYGEGQLSKHP